MTLPLMLQILFFISTVAVGLFAFRPTQGYLKVRGKVRALIENVKRCPDDWHRGYGYDRLYSNRQLDITINCNDKEVYSLRERNMLNKVFDDLESLQIADKTFKRLME